MAKDDRPVPAGADAGGEKAQSESDLQEMLLLRAALALLPVYLGPVSLTDEPRRRR